MDEFVDFFCSQLVMGYRIEEVMEYMAEMQPAIFRDVRLEWKIKSEFHRFAVL